MSLRLFCNMVWARLMAGCASREDRAKIEELVYAPLGGWAQADAAFWAALNQAAEV